MAAARCAREDASLQLEDFAMSKTKGSSDEAIGRPAEWREGRYQRSGQPVDRSVEKTPDNDQPRDAVSTPVTRKDYSQAGASPFDQHDPAKLQRRRRIT
jgi:hypothetical protein